MPTITLLTAEVLPHPETETPAVQQALIDRGVPTTTVPWTRIDPAEVTADLVVIRSTWDYWDHYQRFLDFLAALPVPVHNPPALVAWNSHKSYLPALAAAGAAVVPTAVLPAGQEVDALPGFDGAEIIVKPAVSAGAIGVGRFAVGDPAALAHARDLAADADVLVQPFVPEVTDGERSLIFLGGRYSHAVNKRPAAGEYRVQETFGGTALPYVPVGHDRTAAEWALSALAECLPGTDELLYARVDLVGPVQAPMVMELELIEPELFLPLAPGSVDRFAEAVLARL